MNKKVIQKISLLIMCFLSLSLFGCSDHTHDEFAKCLTQNGVTLYGAYSCHNCKAQLEKFGASAEYLNYVECGKGQSNSNVEACEKAGIKNVPTWIFANGSTLVGLQKLDTLAGKTDCKLPDMKD